MRTIFVLLVAMLAAPAFAAVDVNCTCDGNEVTVRYVNTEPNHVRAFALNIILDNPDANIASVTVNPSVDDYYIYPGSIDVNADTNSIDDYGTLVASKSKYPDGTYRGLDSNDMTIEMASLYYPTGGTSPNAPADSNVLFKFKVDDVPTGTTTVSISENTKRGGIVMEDGNSPTSTNLSTCLLQGGCFPSGHLYFSEWQSVGEPNCWCGSGRQCHGDAGDDQEGDSKLGYFWVSNSDLQVLVDGWFQPYSGDPNVDGGDPGSEPDYWICGDVARDQEGDSKLGYFRVSNSDLQVLVDYWYDKVTVEPNCLTIY